VKSGYDRRNYPQLKLDLNSSITKSQTEVLHADPNSLKTFETLQVEEMFTIFVKDFNLLSTISLCRSKEDLFWLWSPTYLPRENMVLGTTAASSARRKLMEILK
jgi:hypothetical protein